MASLELLVKWYISGLKIYYKKQGTAEALYERRLTVGCSELFDATSTKNSKIKIIKRKLDAGKNNMVVIPLVWGHLFEPTTKKYTSILVDCNIYDAPASVRNHDGVTSCSPDGIGIIRVNFETYKRIYSKQNSIKDIKKVRGNYVFSSLVNFNEPLDYYKRVSAINNCRADPLFARLFDLTHYYTIALFEFKSPYSRTLEKEVKREYMYQVLGGLNIINLCDVGVYSECRFMICTREQFQFNDKFVNFRDGMDDTSGVFSFKRPKMIGCKFFILTGKENPFEDIFNLTSESDLHRVMDCLTVNIDYTTVDYCIVDNDDYSTGRLFDEFVGELSEILSVKLEINPGWNIDQIVKYVTADDRVFAFMYWKLMDNNIAYVNEVHDFVESHLYDVKDVLKTVSLLANMDNMEAHSVLDSLKKTKACRESCVFSEVEDKLKE